MNVFSISHPGSPSGSSKNVGYFQAGLGVWSKPRLNIEQLPSNTPLTFLQTTPPKDDNRVPPGNIFSGQ